MAPITEIATKAGIEEKYLEQYRKYKAKIDYNLLKESDKQDGKLIGVIDPMPVIGDSLYDILFALVSNTDILSTITLEDIYSLINEPKEKIKALLTIVLYSRISRCLKYHPQDIDIYMDFWYSIIK